MLRMQMPAHLDQAGRPAGVGQGQQQDGPDRRGLRRARAERDDRPQAQRRVEPLSVGLPPVQAVAGLLLAGQHAARMRSQPAHDLVPRVQVEEGRQIGVLPVPEQQTRGAKQFHPTDRSAASPLSVAPPRGRSGGGGRRRGCRRRRRGCR
jgi:hypothetical protein